MRSKIDPYTLVRLICVSSDLVSTQVHHSSALKSGFWSSDFTSSSLVASYAKLGFLDKAHQLFVEIPHPSAAQWNALISGYAKGGHGEEAVRVFSGICRSYIRPTEFTFSAALVACCQSASLELGQAIHGEVVKCGFELNLVVGNCLIDMYGRYGITDDAARVFDAMEEKDSVSWNSLISAAARNGKRGWALDLLERMPTPNTISYNVVISGLAQFGYMEDAVKILRCMPTPNPSSWNSIISGFIRQNQPLEAWKLVCQMHSDDVVKDEFTISSILKAAADLSALGYGLALHCCCIKQGLFSHVTVGSALIDMYAKCGDVIHSEMAFECLPIKNLVCYNALLWGYAHNGKVKEVIELFEQMKTVGRVPPDHITFLGVLTACRQDKELLRCGVRYFEAMLIEFGIPATVGLCSCMIDLLGHLGELRRAEQMIYDLGFDSSAAVWRALLGACEFNGDVTVAEVAVSKVVELEGEDEFVYGILSNLYASKGRWDDVMNVRQKMRDGGVRKQAGRSWIEV